MSDSATWIGKAETVARGVLAKHAADVDREDAGPPRASMQLRRLSYSGSRFRHRTAGPGKGRGRLPLS